MNFGAAVAAIRAGEPVILVLSSPGSATQHAVVAYGTYTREQNDYLEIFDPMFGKRRASQRDLLNVHPWVGSYFVE